MLKYAYETSCVPRRNILELIQTEQTLTSLRLCAGWSGYAQFPVKINLQRRNFYREMGRS